MFPRLIIPSLFRGVLKRAEKPATTEAVLLTLSVFALKAPEEASARTAFSFVAVTLAGICLRDRRAGDKLAAQ